VHASEIPTTASRASGTGRKSLLAEQADNHALPSPCAKQRLLPQAVQLSKETWGLRCGNTNAMIRFVRGAMFVRRADRRWRWIV
jgi:hypothetical protein